MKKIEDIFEISPARETSKARGDNSVPKIRVWTLWTPLWVLGFVIVGIFGIVLSWILFFALITDESLLFPLIAMMGVIAPGVLWIIVLLLTNDKEQITRNRVRIQSAIGFLIAIGVAYMLLMPWAFFVIAFRGVSM